MAWGVGADGRQESEWARQLPWVQAVLTSWGEGANPQQEVVSGDVEIRAKRDEGPIAKKDDPCQEPGSGAKPCNHTRRRVPAAQVLVSASSRDISHPHLPLLQPPCPKHCFLQRGNAWSWLHLPATSPVLGSELRHYFCLVSALCGRVAVLVLLVTPLPSARTTSTSAGFSATSQT
ncbi:hypothetical protein J1605_017309 [Eschrichtius robustus]|uniref:Uncharacterized protein n=1 Tax=Eschrichtius robustus TaxID=9764 RepID=A0AB34HZH7_ESCRO|nr:hypothetical protein J1605_017309 [Eschrichtius robustus]